LAVLPGTGHNPMIERPKTFNRLADNFLHRGVISSEAPTPAPAQRLGATSVVSS
jgi:hypothetical protein